MSTRILLADEYQIFRQELRALLEKEPDFTVVAEADIGEAVVKLAAEVKPEVVILGLAVARLPGLNIIPQLLSVVPSAKVIGLSMHTDRRLVLEVLKAGAFGYILKENAFEELAMAIRAVQAQKTYISQNLFSTVIQDFIAHLRHDQKQVDAKILDYQEKLRSVAQKLSLAEEEERRRLATELHDHVGQVLALVQIKLGALRESAANGQIEPLNEIRQLIEQTIGYTRSVGFELSPPILYDLGFEATMEWLAEQIQEQYGIHIKVAADRSPKPLNAEVQVLLFHLMRELLTNLVKSLRPNKVSVLISRIESNMRLTIENDGGELELGRESPWSSSDDLRLFGVKERLQSVGGSLEMELGPGLTTLTSVMVPLMEKPTQTANAKLETRVVDQISESLRPDESPLAEISQQSPAEELLQDAEARYDHLLELFPEGLVISSEGQIVYVNPAGLRLFGAKTPAQIIGKALLDVVHPDYREIMQDRASLVEKGIESLPLQEKKFLKIDGKEIDVEIVGKSIIYLRKPAVQIIIKDISERIKTENALRESEQRLANFIDFLPDATLVIDRQGKVIAWNKALEEMTGFKAEDMLGKDNYEYALPFYGERRPILIDLAFKPQEEIAKYPKVKREGPALSAETYFPMVKGNEAYLYEKVSIFRDSRGNIIGAIESIRDITDRLKAEAERLRISKVEPIGNLADDVSQDLNTMLAALQEDIGLAMSDGKLDLEVRDRLTRAKQDCQRAQSFSLQLLTLVKCGVPHKRPVSMVNLLKESAVKTLSDTKSRCELSIPDDLWSVEADEGQINQVIDNLLVNAARAMPEGGVIKISAENILAEGEQDLPISKGKYAKLTFADEGGGISPKYLNKIFDPYFSANQKGSGLSLATAYSIVKNHSGYIKVESQMGVGTTFHIYLPALETCTPPDEHENDNTEGLYEK